MSLHIWRKIYYGMGWEYPETLPEADERQKHLKHVMHRQLKESTRVKKIIIKREPLPVYEVSKPRKIPKRRKRKG